MQPTAPNIAQQCLTVLKAPNSTQPRPTAPNSTQPRPTAPNSAQQRPAPNSAQQRPTAPDTAQQCIISHATIHIVCHHARCMRHQPRMDGSSESESENEPPYPHAPQTICMQKGKKGHASNLREVHICISKEVGDTDVS